MKAASWTAALAFGLALCTGEATAQHAATVPASPSHHGASSHASADLSAPAHLAPAPAGRATAGTVTLEFTTTTTGKQFAPRHVLAVWVSDDQGRFVRTLQCNAARYRRHLVQWNRSSGTNLVDAVTSASLTAHQAHTVTWDCRNAAGEVVQDGRYRLRVEFTEVNGAGPITPETLLQFTKGASPVTLKPLSQAHFKGLALTYKPAAPPSL